jgi:hypothetical protein
MLGLTFLALAGGVMAVAQPAIAQNPGDFGSEDLSGDNGNSIFSNEGLNPFDLIHQSNFGNIPSMGEFMQMQQENIRNEALDFRSRQQELLQQQQSPVTEPAAVQPAEDAAN